MRNSILITSDLSAVVLVDSKSNDHRLSIGRRGVLLSILGTDVVASEVPAALDNHIRELLRGQKPFYEFEIADEEKNQLCISYNEANNAVYIIGVTDMIAELTGPVEIPAQKINAFLVKLKNRPEKGLYADAVILARLEFKKGIGSKKYIRFYYIAEKADS